jgi:peptidoglycan hydrolase-like protein with peptidoglycan-binding domain
MRNALRRLAFGVLGTGMAVAATMGVTAMTANAATAVPHLTANTCKGHPVKPPFQNWPTVKEGQPDQTNRVTAIQYLLNQHGCYVKVDGKFGSATKQAVIAFQKASGIGPADGIVGNHTWEALIVTVRQGDKGDAVRAVQSYLKYAYKYTTLKVDGIFGSATTAAVKDFQRTYHPPLAIDGIVGPKTWNTLVWLRA